MAGLVYFESKAFSERRESSSGFSYLDCEGTVSVLHFVLGLGESALQTLLHHLGKAAGPNVVCRADKPQD